LNWDTRFRKPLLYPFELRGQGRHRTADEMKTFPVSTEIRPVSSNGYFTRLRASGKSVCRAWRERPARDRSEPVVEKMVNGRKLA
jgi:hypothetical protein